MYVDHAKAGGKKPFIMDMSRGDHKKVNLKYKDKLTRWDFLSTFVPPEDISIESSVIYKLERLAENCPDYEFIAKQFIDTLNGMKGGPVRVKPAKKPKVGPFGANPPPNMFAGPAMFNPGPAMVGPGHGRQANIIKIEKIYNCVIWEKFINEFKRMLRKYPQKKVNDIMKHLFHGTRAADPKLIYASEEGMDFRFSNAGAYGNGIYFANNS